MSRSSLTALALLFALLLAACGGSGDAEQSDCSLGNLPACGGGSGGGGGGVPPPPTGGGGGGVPPPTGGGDPSALVGSVVLVFDATELASAGLDGEEVKVTALVRTATNVALPGVSVEFGVDSGVLAVVNAVTDQNGRAIATLGTGGDRTNRTIMVSARAGARQASAPLAVVGTQVALAGTRELPIGSAATYVATLTDSAGRPVAYTPVSFASQSGNALSGTPVPTDSQGRAKVTLTGSQRGDDVFSASALGSAAVHALRVLADEVVLSPAVTHGSDGAEVVPQAMVGACVPLAARAQFSSSGTAIFTASRGQLFTDAACSAPLSGGVAFSTPDLPPVFLRSASAGIATVDAMLAGGGGGATRIEMVAPLTASATLDLQSSLSVIGAGESVQLLAIVRDGSAGNHPVRGAPVAFSIVSDPSGGTLHAPLTALTGSDGVARASFTGGPAGSPRDGVRIGASLSAPASASATADLTVSRQAISIQFGTGSQRFAYSPSTLQQEFDIFVSDMSGNPVPNATLRVAAWPVMYRKGRYLWEPELPPSLKPGIWRLQLATAFECLNEDVARNGIYDSALDLNGNGVLDPGIPLSVSIGASSDANGMATVSMRYPRDRAGWVRVELTVTGTVAGSESLARHAFWLSPLADDLKDPYLPPAGQVSPYGEQACSVSY